MAKAPNPNDAPANFDDLLATGDTPASTSAVSENDAPDIDALIAATEPAKPLTPAQERLAAARAKKAEMERRAAEEAQLRDAADAAAEADEYEGLSPEEIAELKAIENETAAATAKLVENARETFVPAKGEVTVVHVVEDGFTEFGRVWMRGQELHIDQKAYERTQDRHGNSWMDSLLNDPHEQFRTWGHVYVAPGPFKPRPGEVFDDALAKEDARRGGKIPVIVSD